jgi:hypothetical protein
MSDWKYIARHILTRCFWPPEREIPCTMQISVLNTKCKYYFLLTLSPTSVMSPLGSTSRSGSRQASWTAFQYRSASKGRPKQTLSRMVAFCLQIQYTRLLFHHEDRPGSRRSGSNMLWIHQHGQSPQSCACPRSSPGAMTTFQTPLPPR